MDSDCELSFLDDDHHLLSYVNSLFSFYVLVFKNDDLDMRVIEISEASKLGHVMESVFDNLDSTTQVVMSNGRRDGRCPYFRVVMEKYGPKTSINYKLETFLRRAGVIGVSARCETALVIGMADNDLDSVMVSIPFDYHTIPIACVDMIDMTGTSEAFKKQTGERLMGIPGMLMPYYLPRELHFKILQFVRHQEADAIEDHTKMLEDIFAYWDLHFASVVHSLGSW